MSKWPNTKPGRFQAVALSILLQLWAGNTHSAEQRCNDLGASCVCSEPLNMTSFSGGPDLWNPTDSTTKQCAVDQAVPGSAIDRQSILSSADSTALAALPPGHSVSRFLRAQDNHQGQFYVGHAAPVSSSLVRLAARWYIWHTPTFDFKLEGSCDNSKITQHDHNALIDYTDGFHTYGYQNFKPSSDCCVSGPGANSGMGTSAMKGRWWRLEVVMTNRSGPNFDLKLYARNVTDNGPELTLIDLASSSQTRSLTPPGLMSMILSNNHRFSASGQCRGWLGISHYMMAGWTTNAGQRIGPASEIEGGGGGGPGPIPPPTNLKVSELFEELRSSSRLAAAAPQLPPALRAWRVRPARSG